MALSRLSADNLAYITRLLTSNAVYSLIFCGSRDLNAKLLAETSILQFELGLRSPFPFSAYQFRQLRHLRVSMKEDFHSIPLNLNGASMLPREPMKSLVKLGLFVPQSFAILGSSEASLSLSECFPNLEVLRLGGSITSALERDHLERLPRTLRDLTLRRAGLSRTQMPIEWIGLLPTNLERLSLPSFNLTEHEAHEMTSTIAWPSGLTKLRVGRLPGRRHLPTLPKGLTKFVAATESAGTSEDILMSSLPSSLTHLVISQAYNTVLVLDAPLNSCMEVCRVPPMMLPGGQRPDPESSHTLHVPLASLPKTLKTISGIQHEATPDNVAQLPRALERLLLGRNFRGFTNYAALPSLTFLSISDEASEGVEVPYDALPRTITNLSSSFTKESQLENLPDALLELRITTRRDNTVACFGPNAMAKLPRSLTSLTVALSLFTSREALFGLPPLKKIFFLPRVCASPVGVDPLLMQVLPTSLEFLRLSPLESLTPFNTWVRDLAHLTKLRTLWLSPNSVAPDEKLCNHEMLVGLPTTLTKLYILTGPNWANNTDLLDHLPPGLINLRVSAMYYDVEPAPFKNHHLTKLPPSLTHLSVTPTSQISEDFSKRRLLISAASTSNRLLQDSEKPSVYFTKSHTGKDTPPLPRE